MTIVGAPEGDVHFLAQAITLAQTNVTDGGGPFGAVIVDDVHRMLAWGVNRVTATPDPTAHAEVEAIRAAARETGSFSLVGCTLYASCEPCPMCLACALWARVDRVVYAADRSDAADAGFDDSAFHDLFSTRDDVPWPLTRQHLAHPDALAPFHDWASSADRTGY